MQKGLFKKILFIVHCSLFIVSFLFSYDFSFAKGGSTSTSANITAADCSTGQFFANSKCNDKIVNGQACFSGTGVAPKDSCQSGYCDKNKNCATDVDCSGSGKYRMTTGAPFLGLGDGQCINVDTGMDVFLTNILKFILGSVGTVTTILIIVSGFQWAFSAGSPKIISEATSRITNAVIGLALTLTCGLMLQVINPQLINFGGDQGLFKKMNPSSVSIDAVDINVSGSDQCNYAFIKANVNKKPVDPTYGYVNSSRENKDCAGLPNLDFGDLYRSKPSCTTNYGVNWLSSANNGKGRCRLHVGYDFTKNEGSDVLSVYDGVVSAREIASGSCDANAMKDSKSCPNQFGSYVDVTTAEGVIIKYPHLSVIDSSITLGSRVSRGSLIGKEGKSGYVTGSHVHFEVTYRPSPTKVGIKVDPWCFFQSNPTMLAVINSCPAK